MEGDDSLFGDAVSQGLSPSGGEARRWLQNISCGQTELWLPGQCRLQEPAWVGPRATGLVGLGGVYLYHPEPPGQGQKMLRGGGWEGRSRHREKLVGRAWGWPAGDKRRDIPMNSASHVTRGL